MTHLEESMSGPRLGASLFLSEPAEDNLARLAAFPERGLTQAFTSLHIPEDTNVAAQPRLLRELGEAARAAGVTLYADVSPLTLRRLALPGASDVEQLVALGEWGVGGVRFDFGFPIATAAGVSRAMPVQLNASTVTEAETAAFLLAGGVADNVEVLHNYYPREDTGLARPAFQSANRRFRAAGFRAGAFVPGDAALRGPLHAGLPTLEEHRGADPVLAAVDLWRGDPSGEGVDTIYVGDVDLRAETWARWAHLRDGVVPIRWECTVPEGSAEAGFADLLSGGRLSNRIDEAALVIRVHETRALTADPHAHRIDIDADGPGSGAQRPRGSVTVDNRGYGRYHGEAQITRADRPADPRVTVLGAVVAADLALLDLLPGGAAFVLVSP